MRTTAVWMFVATLVLGGAALVYAAGPTSGEPAVSAASAAPAQTNSPAKSSSATTANGDSVKAPPEVEKAMQMPEGDDRIKALSSAASDWAKKNPPAALAWYFQLPKGLPEKLFIPVLCANPQVSADWLIQNNKTGVNNGNLHGVLVTWGRVDPAAATAWVQKVQIAAKDVRSTAFFSVADGYARRNPKDAGAWAEKVEAKEDRFDAIRGVAMMWGRGNVTTSADWIKQLKPEEMKVAIKTITGEWWMTKLKSPGATTKAEAVKPWLDQFPLSDKEKEELLK
jgi:hypothetical protein